MKKLLAILLAVMLLLCGCAKTDGPKPSDGSAPDSKTSDTSKPKENKEDEFKWGDTDSQLYKDYWALSNDERQTKDLEDARRYKDAMGITSLRDVDGMTRTYSGDYYLTTYYIVDLHTIGYYLDTNYSDNFKIKIEAVERNLETGKEKTIKDSVKCDLGGYLKLSADEGYIIVSYTIDCNFPTHPEKIEDEYSDRQIENMLLQEMLAGMTEEEQDAYWQQQQEEFRTNNLG